MKVMKHLRIIITVLTGAAFASNVHLFASALPATNTTHYLRQRASEGNHYHSHSTQALRDHRSLKQDSAGSGNNGSGIGNGGINSMRYIATVQGKKKDGTVIFVMALGDTIAAAKATGNEKLKEIGATPVAVGNGRKERALYVEWGHRLSPDEGNIRKVIDFTMNGWSAKVEDAMNMWNNVGTSSFVYELTDPDGRDINPGSACSKRGPYDTWKTISNADLGKRKGNGIVLGMFAAEVRLIKRDSWMGTWTLSTIAILISTRGGLELLTVPHKFLYMSLGICLVLAIVVRQTPSWLHTMMT